MEKNAILNLIYSLEFEALYLGFDVQFPVGEFL